MDEWLPMVPFLLYIAKKYRKKTEKHFNSFEGKNSDQEDTEQGWYTELHDFHNSALNLITDKKKMADNLNIWWLYSGRPQKLSLIGL